MELLDVITRFINEIGIPCSPGNVRDDSFLPGVDIVNGEILYDSINLRSEGDLLHEAGHVAVVTIKDRKTLTSPTVSGDLQEGGAEMAAIAWSWAALTHLDIPPEVVFHKEGYKGDAEDIIANFSKGRYFGVSTLAWMQMTQDPNGSLPVEEDFFPEMSNWLRQ